MAQGPAIGSAPPGTAPAAGDFHSYSLRHVAAEQVRGELTAMLTSLSEPGEVVIDPETNRLFVRGGERVHQLARQVIESLDRPTAESTRPATPPTSGGQAAEQPVLRPYPMLPSHEPQIIRLERQHASRSDVRIARDARTSQLLVLAPEAVHAEVKQILSGSPNPRQEPPHVVPEPVAQPLAMGDAAGRVDRYGIASPAENAAQPPPESDYRGRPTPQLARRVLQLRNLAIDEVHSRLEQVTSSPLPLHEDATRANVQFGIEAAPGVRMSVSADRHTGRVVVVGPQQVADGWARAISAMDEVDADGRSVTRLVSAPNAPRDQVQLVAETLSAQPDRRAQGRQAIYNGRRGGDGQFVAMLFQPDGQADFGQVPPADGAGAQGGGQPGFQPGQAITPAPGPAAGLIGPVQIEAVEGTDFLIIQGDARDVEQVMKMIEALEQELIENPPQVEIVPLAHVDSQAMATLVNQVYENVLTLRLGTVSITPLVKPNALLLIGRPENVETVINLVRRLDQPVPPATQFEVFFLEHASALDIQAQIDQFFAPPEDAAAAGLAPRVLATADYRSNSVIVRAAPRDMVEVRSLIERLDTANIGTTDVVRTFYLRNALAAEVADVLLNALTAQGQVGQQPGGPGGFQPGAGPGQAGQQATQPKSRGLSIVTIDATGDAQTVTSGILTDIRISADERSNALVVTAPRESMDLIAELIAQLDRVPSLQAEVKVFEIQNGDATALANVLRELFGQPVGGAAGQQAAAAAGIAPIGAGETSLVPLTFAVDERTNSIIATGTPEDLRVVHAILLTLDEAEDRGRGYRVFRLKNLFAPDVALALTDWLTQQREVQQILPGGVSAIEQIEREAVIVPEEASNSLIISATPQLFRELEAIIAEIDARPPMVMIQVLIAEVSLNDTDEFGVEIGLQDSLLFDRSLLEVIDTTTNIVTETTPGGAVTTVQEEIIQSATIAPGFLFGNPLTSLGNSGSNRSLATAGKVGTQGLTNFGVGRVNSDLGFGGFVFSAGSENVSLLLRALQESRRLEVLSRPQIMALDNQFAVVQVGQRVPFIVGSTITAGVQQNDFQFQEVGLILRVQPRVSPDGMVVMRIEAEKSNVGPEEEGIPLTTSATGDVVRVPRINRTFAGTIVQALSGQTIVLGGLISKSTTDIHRRVPLIADIPLIGDLFRYDGTAEQRNELLIIMTPRVVRNYLDAEILKQVESSRMNWVLSDVVALHGPSGLRGRTDNWTDAECEAVYPTHVPGEGDMLLPISEAQPQPTPALGPTPDPPLESSLELGRYESIEYGAAPAVYHGESPQAQPAQQSAYQQLIPLPPTE